MHIFASHFYRIGTCNKYITDSYVDRTQIARSSPIGNIFTLILLEEPLNKLQNYSSVARTEATRRSTERCEYAQLH